MNVSIPSKVFNMTLVSNVKKQLERVDSTSQIIGTRDDSRDTESWSRNLDPASHAVGPKKKKSL